MIQIQTANGDLFEVLWVGVSNIDGALRFSIINPDINNIFQVFTNPENNKTIIRLNDNNEKEKYEGYINFRGMQLSYDGNALVTLSKI